MSVLLAHEEEVDADARFRNFMRHALATAAQHFSVMVSAAPSFGWRLRSISAPVEAHGERLWLKVASQELEWAKGPQWTGNLEANVITAVRKPHVRGVHEWVEYDWRRQWAELMTWMPGTLASPSDAMSEPVAQPEAWWTALQEAVLALGATATDRVHADAERVCGRIQDVLGLSVSWEVQDWATAHGDLHWANLLGPELSVLDWELWGRAPAGLDAATLLVYALAEPTTAHWVRAMFGDQLNTPTGRIAQLYVCARLTQRMEQGDHRHLRPAIERHVAEIARADRSVS